MRNLINNAKAPEKKKTKNENTKVKLLYNLYREGKLKVHKDGLVTITYIDQNGTRYQAVSVPTVLFPGLMFALHYKLDHPSKLQLTKLVVRHFYTPGYQRIIDEVVNSCETCTALRQLPKEIFSESTGTIDGLGSHFSADVIERNQQNILIVREKLSSFTFTRFIKDQTAETLKQALITMILDMVPHSGTVVQVDCATAWQTLANESTTEKSQLKRLNITIELGRHHNTNKNPVSDNACKEFHKEVLRIKPEGTKLTDIERAIVTSNMNQRIRKSGFSSKEICFKRDLISNSNKPVNDEKIANDIIEDRKRRHKTPTDATQQQAHVGHNVFLKKDKSKLRARELYKVMETFSDNGEQWAIIQKHNSQFRIKKYKVKASELILLPGQEANITAELNQEYTDDSTPDSASDEDENRHTKPKRRAAMIAREKIAQTMMVKSKKKDPSTHG